MKDRIVKIESNPFLKCAVKVQFSNVATNNGTPIKDSSGNVRRVYETPENITRLPGTQVVYSAVLNNKGGLDTGLDEIVHNEFANEPYYPENWERVLRGKKVVKLQHLLEYKHGKPFNYYAGVIKPIQSSRKVRAEGNFYQRPESRVALSDGVTILNLANPIHEINYYMLRAHPNVANSYEEVKNNSNATHFIVDQGEMDKAKSSELRRVNAIGRYLEELDELEDNTIINMAKALELSSGMSSKDAAYTAIHRFANTSEEKFMEFKSMYLMWNDPVTREKFLTYAELTDYIKTPGLISRRNHKYFWNKPIKGESGRTETFEWNSKSDVVNNFLLAPEYREDVDILREQYEMKRTYL